MAANTNKVVTEYTLSDGSAITAMQLAYKVGISTSAARYRLSKSTNVDELFKSKKHLSPKKGKYKIYRLDDGTTWTVKDLVSKLGVSPSCASNRLCSSNKAEYVLQPKRVFNSPLKAEVTKRVQNSMFFDPLGHWALLNKHV
jgi:Zn-dependent peptidase ImmA (M78 family)